MRAWWVTAQGPVRGGPLRFGERPDPEPGPGEVLVRVLACGVCRTDLHVVEGDLPLHRPEVVPGHEIVGEVTALGPGCERFAVGARVGIAWLRHTCGHCRFCRRGAENLCLTPRFTGWDHRLPVVETG
jgi:propanol-preferring alcohol dehydrogenase